MAAAVKRVVARLDPTYVEGERPFSPEEANMPDSASRSLPFAGQPAVIAIAAVVGVLVAATVALWVHYGTAVFYEMILAGMNACF